MEPPSDPPKNPGGDDSDGEQFNDRKPAADMTDVDRTNALKSHRIRYQDAIDPNAERVTNIRPNDVLLGRGKRLQDRKGNVRMRKIAKKYSASYHYLKPSQKKELIESVYMEIIENGARFLIKGGSTAEEGDDDNDEKEEFYLVVDEEIALQKISNILRRKKPIYAQAPGIGTITGGAGLDPAVQVHQALIAGRSHVGNVNHPASSVASINPQVTGLGNQVARLPTNPLLSSSLTSLPYASLHNHLLPGLPATTNPTSDPMRMQIMANMMERDRMVRDVLTIQQLSALQDSRSAAIYAQSLNQSAVVFPPLASNATASTARVPQPQANNGDADKDKTQDTE